MPYKKYKKPDYVGTSGRSVGDLSTQQMADDIGPLDAGEVPDKGRDHNPGRAIYRRELEEFAALSDNDKLEALRGVWKEIAMGAAVRAKLFVKQCSPAEFSTLQKLISAAETGIQNAFPQKREATSPQFIVNMFGSLGQR